MAIDKFKRVDITLDKANKYIIGDQLAKVGDMQGRDLVVQITNAGVIQNQPDINLTFSWHNKKIGNSGMTDFKALDRSQGVFIVTFPDAMNNAGNVVATIGVNEADKWTFSRNFIIKVEDNSFSASIPLESDDWSILLEAIDKVNHLSELTEEQLNEFMDKSKEEWLAFVNANKEIIEAIDPGGVLLSEITSARQDAEGNVYASIGKRLDDLYHGYSDKLGLKGDVIADAAAKVANIKIDKSILKIGLINDLHFQKMVDPSWYNTATLDADHVKLYGLFANKINAIVLNGDNVHGQEIGEDSTGLVPFSGSREVLIKRNKEIMDIANYAVPNADVFANIGNHDDGSVRWSNPLTLDELKQGYDVESFDAFKDYADQKVRVIILNIFDNSETELKRATNSVIKQSQLDWLANTALKVPAGYATVIFTHAPLEGFFYNKPYSADWKNINHDLVKGMLAAFIHGTAYYGDGDNGTVNVDFTKQGARDLIGIVSGHEHVDTEPEFNNGIRGFMRTCSVGIGTGRVLGEYSELASDLIEIDVANRTIKFNRIGYGDDLKVTY